MSDEGKKTPSLPPPPFTIDVSKRTGETTGKVKEVPTISTLLGRKKATISESSKLIVADQMKRNQPPAGPVPPPFKGKPAAAPPGMPPTPAAAAPAPRNARDIQVSEKSLANIQVPKNFEPNDATGQWVLSLTEGTHTQGAKTRTKTAPTPGAVPTATATAAPAPAIEQVAAPVLAMPPMDAAPGPAGLAQALATPALAIPAGDPAGLQPPENFGGLTQPGIGTATLAGPALVGGSEPPPAYEPTRAPSVVAASAPGVSSVKPKPVQQGRRRPNGATPLIGWNPEQLRKGGDPLAQGLQHLMEKGGTAAVFLGISAPAPGANVPQFTASAAINAQAREAIWTGLRWNAALIPEVWNQFLRTGWVELAPPSTMTNQHSIRNVLRGAFGVAANEYLLLIRCGPANACRGVLAVVSFQTLTQDMGPAITFIGQAVQKKAA